MTADLSLQLMDFNVRQYDPQLGRFRNIDLLAAMGGQAGMSQYAAMGNQPEWMTDPMALAPPQKMGNSGSCWVVNDNVGDMTGATAASGGNGNPISYSLARPLDPLNLGAGAGFPGLVQNAMQHAANETFWQTFTGTAEKGTVYVSDDKGGFNIRGAAATSDDPTIDYSMIDYNNYQPIDCSSSAAAGFVGDLKTPGMALRAISR